MCCDSGEKHQVGVAEKTLQRANTFKQLQKAAKKAPNRDLSDLISQVAGKNGKDPTFNALGNLALAEKINDFEFDKFDNEDDDGDDDLDGLYRDLLDEDNNEISNQFTRTKTQVKNAQTAEA